MIIFWIVPFFINDGISHCTPLRCDLRNIPVGDRGAFYPEDPPLGGEMCKICFNIHDIS